MPRPSFAPNLRFVFLLQLFGMQPLKPLSYVPLFHLPALPDRRPPGGDFVVVQRLRPGAQAVGQALRGEGLVLCLFADL